jgi:hypothetical protein
MNLVKSFPEIDSFFKNNQFTNLELEELHDLVRRYSDAEMRKAAMSLIKLELLKFNINAEEIAGKVLIADKKIHNLDSRSSNESKDSNIGKSVCALANDLNWSVQKIKSLLMQKGISKTDDEYLTAAELILVKDMIEARTIALCRINKKDSFDKKYINTKKKLNNSNNKVPGVYGQIAKYGLGKIIYTRMS